ncbi:MAG: MFS transporter, partial [Rhizobacter sp.]
DVNASSGNSLLSVVMQLSMSLGVAAGAALLVAFTGVSSVAQGTETLQAFHATFLCVGVLSAVAACIFLQLGRGEAPGGKPSVLDES